MGVTGVQTFALPIWMEVADMSAPVPRRRPRRARRADHTSRAGHPPPLGDRLSEDRPRRPSGRSAMRIAVTGGSGKLGRSVVAYLREAGHEVFNLDRAGERGPAFIQIDLTDYGQVVDALNSGDDR